jgi:DNA-binding response OmpR family regulator
MKPEIPKALIVDDELDICFLLTGIFKNKNVPAKVANTLAEAKILMEKYKPSILFLDNHLPDGFGFQFLDFVKEHYPETKIAMITANDSPSDKTMAFKKGADYFIGKPFSVSIVRKTIDDLIARA